MFKIRFTPGADPQLVARSRDHRSAPARRVLRTAIAVSSMVWVTGCSLWSAAPVDERVRHVLDARPSGAPSVTRDLVLSVKPPHAAPGFESSRIAYVQKPYALDYYAAHEWADTPARMLGQLLTRTLEDTGSFRAVVQGGSGLPADLQLDTEIVRLRQSFLTNPSVVEITLRVQLIDLPYRRVLATRYIEAVENALSEDAPGGVAAANVAVARTLAQVASFCVDASADLRPNPPKRH